jgi:hypothetical protein
MRPHGPRPTAQAAPASPYDTAETLLADGLNVFGFVIGLWIADWSGPDHLFLRP